MLRMISTLAKSSSSGPKNAQTDSNHSTRKGNGRSYILVTGRSRTHNHKFVSDVHQNSQNHADISREGIELVATGGFDYPDKSDVDAFTGIAEEVLRRKGVNQHIVGVVVIHLTEDKILSGSFQRNIRGLTDLFLGKSHLDRLTILVARADSSGPDQKSIVQDMHSPQALVFSELLFGRATIAVWKRDTMKHLRPYFSKGPISPPVYHFNFAQESVRTQVEVALGYYLKESVDMWASAYQKRLAETLKKAEANVEGYKKSAEQASQNLDQSQADLLQLQAKQRNTEEEAAQYRAECERVTQLYMEQLQANEQQVKQYSRDPKARVSQLAQRLHQVEAEYASLRSQIQLHNNYEQGEISRDLKNLNSMIERLGQSLSEYLVDNYAQDAFRKDGDDITTLDAHDLAKLMSIFGHHEGSPSLVASAKSSGLNIENFIDFSIRAQICHSLVQLIFDPFHPFIDPVESSKYATTYEQVRRQESQYTSGKWRSVTFNNIYHPPTSHKPVADHINGLAEGMMMDILGPLIKHLFGWSIQQIRIEEQHFVELLEVINAAWEWSSKVKREVVMLGDFQPTTIDVHRGPVPFDPQTMEDFEPDARGPQPKFALCILGLGLSSWQARGGGEPPEGALVHKMTVLTDAYY
ncbi:unnamed protein product [Rhizoctonia solani]|uniref:Uncharacterized protein n=2 Tax=Rhizoctonia solani TaxID=456999 RepID=A0A8H3HRF3_9AGAM